MRKFSYIVRNGVPAHSGESCFSPPPDFLFLSPPSPFLISRPFFRNMTDTYIHWKQEYYDQDVIKSYCSYICDILARKNTLTAYPPFLQNPLSRSQDPPYPSVIFPSPFLGIFGKVNPLFFKKKKGEGRGSNYAVS